MPHISGQSLIMEKDSRWNNIHIIEIFLTRKQQKQYNILREPYYIMPGKLIKQYCKMLMKYCGFNQIQQRTPRNCFYYIMQQHTQIQSSAMKPVTWSYMWIQMRNISPCQRQEVIMLDIYWPSLRQIKPTPKRNSPIHKECKTIHNSVYEASEAEPCGTFNNRKTSIGM